MATFTLVNMAEIDDVAPGYGLGHAWEARMARIALEAEQTGLAFYRLRPGSRSPFAHRHADAEEIYVVLRGSGQVKLDDELREVRPLDAVRVSASVVRAFEAGPDGLDFIALGPHYDDDGELVEDRWTDDPRP